MAVAIKTARPWSFVDLRTVRLEEANASDGMHRSWIMLLPEGTFDHPKYGELNLSHATLGEIKQHFDAGVRGIEIALDYDHKASEGDSKAPGWIEALCFGEDMGKPAGLWARVRWTRIGLADVQDQIYRYISAEFKPDYTDDMTGKSYHNVLLGATLTNRPFMKVMPAIALAEVSTRAWGSVDKSCLPDSAFLDPKNRRLPVYEGTGPKDAKGRYTQRGKLNINGVKAALGAVHGARSGKAMTGLPAGIASKLQGWLDKYGGGGGDSTKASEVVGGGQGGTMTRIKRSPSDADLERIRQQEAAVLLSSTVNKGTGQGKQTGQTKRANFDDSGGATDDSGETYDDGDDSGDAMDDGDTGGDELDDDDGGDTYDDSSDSDSSDSDTAAGAPDVQMGKGRGGRKMSKGGGRGGRKMSEDDGDGERVSLAEYRQLAEDNRRMAYLLYEGRVEKKLAAFAPSSIKLAEGEQDAAVLSKRFKDAYRRFMLSSGGIRLSEDGREQVDSLIQAALKFAILDLHRKGASSDFLKRQTIRASDERAGPHQGIRLAEAQAELADEAGVNLDELRRKAQRGDREAAKKVVELLEKAAEQIKYQGVFGPDLNGRN